MCIIYSENCLLSTTLLSSLLIIGDPSADQSVFAFVIITVSYERCSQMFLKFARFQGLIDLRVWPGDEGSEETPGKASDKGKEQMQRLAKLAKKHRNGHISKVFFLSFSLNSSNTRHMY